MVTGRVYVVLVNWNGWADSIECMESLFRSDHRDFVVLVVDNASTDGSVERMVDWAEGRIPARESPTPRLRALTTPSHPKPIRWRICTSEEVEEACRAGAASEAARRLGGDARLIIVRAGRNGGFGAGNNLAFKLIRARGDGAFVWVLNNDTVVPPATMSDLARLAGERGAIVGGTLRYYHQPDRIQVYSGGRLSRWTGLLRTATRAPPRRIDYVNGACFMLGTSALEAVGGFDEDIFLYFEENDFCIRAGQRALRCLPSDALVYHKHGAASAQRDDSFAWRHVLQNKAYVLKKNWGLGLWFPIHLATLLASAAGLQGSPGKRKAARAILATWWREPHRIFLPSPPG